MSKHVSFHLFIRSRSWWVGTNLAAMGLLSSSLLGRLLGRHFLTSSFDTCLKFPLFWQYFSSHQDSRLTEGKFSRKKCLALQMLKLGKWKLSQSYNFWKSLHFHVLYALYWWLSENTNFVLQESEGFPVDHYQLFFCLWFLLSLLDTGWSQNYLQIYVLKFLWSLWLQENNCLRNVIKSSSNSEVAE